MQTFHSKPEDAPPQTLWPWLLLAMLWCVALLNYLDRQVIFSIFPLLQRDLHATSVELGLCGTVFLLFYGVTSPFAGFAADRYGHRRIILLSLTIWSIASLMAGHAHSMSEMLTTRAAMGLSEAFYIPAALGLLVKVHQDRFRSLATGIHQTGCYAGIIAGGTLGGLAEHTYSWRSLFAVLGACGVLYAIVLGLMLRRGSRGDSSTAAKPDFLPLLRSRGLRIYTIVFMVFSIATWMLYTWLPLYLYEHFHMSLAAAGFEATFWLQTASFLGAFLGGILSDRLASRARGVRMLVQAGGLAIVCPFLLVLSHTNSHHMVILALISIGLGRGCFDANTAPIMAQVVGAEQCSSAYGILNCAGCIIAGLTTLAGGWMRQNMSFSLVFAGAGGVLVAGVVCLLLLARQTGGPSGAKPSTVCS
jgi:MFS family permease